MSVFTIIRRFTRAILASASIALLVITCVVTIHGLSTAPDHVCSADDSADMGCVMAAHPARTAFFVDGLLLLPAAGLCLLGVALTGPRRRTSAAV